MKKISKYDPKTVESNILNFWERSNIYEKAKKRSGNNKFYFLDGPPYANGRIHLGHAWNKVLKDMILRYKRMTGHNVWDRAGYDMHGLPTENATMKKLGLKDKEDIKKFGVDKFIEECRKLCLNNMDAMSKEFWGMGVWMDFKNAYKTITREFMSGEWWLIKRAHEEGRLYEGLRTMTWCPITESALAKHELEYKTVVDESIFVKFKLLDKNGDRPENEFLIIWTTTPWTIPFNLAVMVNPEVNYAKVHVKSSGDKVIDEYWYIAQPLVGVFLGSVVDADYEIIEELSGGSMEGWRYEHPFYGDLKEIYDDIIEKSPKAFTVLLSKEYVDTSGGSGLVHCAPGCGPEDYEVGYRNGLPPFNNIDTKGVFPQSMGPFSGFTAKKDDKKFIQALDNRGALIASTPVEHEYPHDWRHHSPVIFRTTKQWFFKIEDIKDKLVEENKKIKWIPDAAYNAFESWLSNLRDNSISKQRFWGCPLPVWRNTDPEAPDNDYIVVGSADELEKLSGQKIDDLHLPTVDNIIINKNGKTYRRVPDVLDVWVDAGTTSWNCLDHDPELIKEWFPADFILEGKDQIRGWFNLLHIASMLAYKKPSFKACYMHGFINDSQGRKMSKSLSNYITPGEVLEKYGADTWRYYAIGSTNPGLDMNYNFDDIELKHRNLMVFWNIHKFLLDLKRSGRLELKKPDDGLLGVEERFILSRINRSIKRATEAFNEYRLNEVPLIIEECLLDLSRTYIQLVREKASVGSKKEKETVLWTAWTVYKSALLAFSTIAPFFTEQIYQEMKSEFMLDKESVHFEGWPSFDESLIDDALESEIRIAQSVISAALYAREKAGLGVRWPLPEMIIEASRDNVNHAVTNLSSLIKQQANVREIILDKTPVSVVVKPDYRAISKAFGEKTADVGEAIKSNSKAISEVLAAGEKEFDIGGYHISKDLLDLSFKAPDGFSVSEFPGGILVLKTSLTPELEAEGLARELVRRVQQMRKDKGMEKHERIILSIVGNKDLLKRIADFSDYLQEKVGASKLLFGESNAGLNNRREVVIKGSKFVLSFDKEAQC